MSLASFLLGGSKTSKEKSPQLVQVDKELDALFSSNPTPPAASYFVESPTLSPLNAQPSGSRPTKTSKRQREEDAGREHPRTFPNIVGSKVSPRKDTKKRHPVAVADAEQVGTSDEEVGNDASLEDNYLSRRTAQKTGHTQGPEDPSGIDSSGDDEISLPLVHETQGESDRRKPRFKSKKKEKYIPPEETPAQRDARTIFVGNVPIAVAKSKSWQKQLKKHFLSFVTGSKIESVRFRSVAFASATTALPTEDNKTSLSKKGDTLSTKQQRQHDRAAQWRESVASDGKNSRKRPREDDETSEREDSHNNARKASCLTPAEQKRVAFIKGEFHKEVDTVNAYIVFAHNVPSDDHESTAGGRTLQLHPFEAAKLAVEKCNGSLFMEKTIRVDRVGQWRAGIVDGPGVGGDDVGMLDDPRATLFIGNLDFAAKEEELRVWFEGVVTQERGPPPLFGEKSATEGKAGGEDVDGENGRGVQENCQRWVRSVRIVRDRDTQLGKGFAYVRFLDRECVDEILGLEPPKLKFAKRKLRVQRCKVVTRSSVSATAKRHKTIPTVSPRTKKVEATTSFVPVPKGDPSLGEKLAGLSKEERKAAKAANVDRQKRRMAKKKARDNVKKAEGGKDKMRERSRLQNKSGGKAKVAIKGRIRSEKSMAKRNAKK